LNNLNKKKIYPRVLFTEPEAYSKSLRNDLPKYWNCTFKNFSNEKKLISYLNKNSFEIIIGKLGLSFDKKFFQSAKSLKIFATPTTGLDHIDLKAASKRKIHVISLRGELSILKKITSTAEHAWALLLACNRNLIRLVNKTKSGYWRRVGFQLNQLSGKKIGIIGYGRIGKMLAQYAKAFRMHIFIFDKNINTAKFSNRISSVSLKNLLSTSDYIILSASYSVGDPIIMTKKNIMSIKPGAIFINISRGELVDESAIIEALKINRISMIGLDVLNGDSKWNNLKKIQSPILRLSKKSDRIILTPHVGGYAKEAIESTRRFILQKVDKVIYKSIN
jgi:D-3-phosphoglycerate dehydrogenase